MSDYSEYTKARDIAQKRLKRMEASGIRVDYKIPTVKEIKAGKANLADSFRMVNSFLSSSMNLSSMRESSRIHYTPEEAAEKKRQYQRRYRRQRVAREHERAAYPKKYQGYTKALETLGIDLKPSQLPGFYEYMDYRLSQGNTAGKYVFDIFAKEYVQLLQKGYKPGQIIADYQQFMADQYAISGRADAMQGWTVQEFNDSWAQFIGSDDFWDEDDFDI